MIGTIAMRELRALLLTPAGWIILAVTQGLLSYSFLVQVDNFLRVQGKLAGIPGAPGVTEVIVMPFYGNAAFLLLMVVPLLTMRLISEERRAQTLSLLLAAPLSFTELVLGKFLGVMLFLVVLVTLLAAMPLALLWGSQLDLGMWSVGALGLLLLLASFAAVGLFMSALTAQPVTAAIASFGVLLLLWILDWQGDVAGAESWLAQLSLLAHIRPMLSGLVDTRDVVFFFALIALFLGLAVHRLAAMVRK
jgi:ABC-2 type transport system permease protein